MREEIKKIETGTTNIGLVCKDGIILAADRRITSGNLISGKFEKVAIISEELAVAFAGGVSDVQFLKKIAQAQLRLEQYRIGKKVSVKKFANLAATLIYSNIRKFSPFLGIAHFILGGKDDLGFHLYELGATGEVIKFDDFTSAGSGSVTAYGVLDALYKKDITIKEGITLAKQAINAAIQRDNYSGQGIDIITVTKDGVKKIYTEELEAKLKI